MVGKTENPDWVDPLNPPESEPKPGFHTTVIGVLKPEDARPSELVELGKMPGVETEVIENGDTVIKVNSLVLPKKKKK